MGIRKNIKRNLQRDSIYQKQVWNVLNNNQLNTFNVYMIYKNIHHVCEKLNYKNQTKFTELIGWKRILYSSFWWDVLWYTANIYKNHIYWPLTWKFRKYEIPAFSLLCMYSVHAKFDLIPLNVYRIIACYC